MSNRVQEIENAWNSINSIYPRNSIIPVVPVRMTEAWLLFDERSIKIAAGNYSYSDSLPLPSLQKIEKLPNPKATLYELIRNTSNLRGRQLAKLKISQRVHVVADNITDFSPLRQLPAFRQLEEDIKHTLTKYLSE